MAHLPNEKPSQHALELSELESLRTEVPGTDTLTTGRKYAIAALIVLANIVPVYISLSFVIGGLTKSRCSHSVLVWAEDWSLPSLLVSIVQAKQLGSLHLTRRLVQLSYPRRKLMELLQA